MVASWPILTRRRSRDETLPAPLAVAADTAPVRAGTLCPACPFSVRYRTQDGREYECHAESFTESAVLAETMAEAGIQVTSWGDRNGAPGAISAQSLH